MASLEEQITLAALEADEPLADWLAMAADQLERGEEVDPNDPNLGLAASALQNLLPTMKDLIALGKQGDSRLNMRIDPELDRPLIPSMNGRNLGEFRLIRELGRGGMGVVFVAEQLSLGRMVAVKVLTSTAAIDERRRKRFEFEARAAAALHHPHIVPVYSVGVDQGTLYYAMQLIPGCNLAELIAQVRSSRKQTSDFTATTVINKVRDMDSEPTSEWPKTQSDLLCKNLPKPGTTAYHRFAAQLIAVVAEALEHAHADGIIHRDVKPGNLLIEPNGWVWITDFGLAAATSANGMTHTGDIVGTARYMSPEQTIGQRGLVDHRSDVYSLGITLYESLALEPAFRGTTAEVIRRVPTDSPVSLRRFDPTIAQDLLVIVEKAIEKNPADRYQSAGELAADLNRFVTGQPILARSPTSTERLRRWSYRHRGRLLFLSIVAVVLCSVSTVSWWVTRSALEKERQAHTEAEIRLLESHALFESTVLRVVADNQIRDPAFELLRSSFMEKGADYLERFIRDHSNNLVLQPGMACALEQLAEIRRRQGDWEQAIFLFQQALQRYEQLIDQTDGPLREAYRERKVCVTQLADSLSVSKGK